MPFNTIKAAVHLTLKEAANTRPDLLKRVQLNRQQNYLNFDYSASSDNTRHINNDKARKEIDKKLIKEKQKSNLAETVANRIINSTTNNSNTWNIILQMLNAALLKEAKKNPDKFLEEHANWIHVPTANEVRESGGELNDADKVKLAKDRLNYMQNSLWTSGTGWEARAKYLDPRKDLDLITDAYQSATFAPRLVERTLEMLPFAKPAQTLTMMGMGYLGGKATDKVVDLITPYDSWKDLATRRWGWDDTAATFSNPGMWIAGWKSKGLGKAVQNNIDYSLARGKWYAPAEYAIAHSPVGKRAVYMAMNSTDFGEPNFLFRQYLKDQFKNLGNREVQKRTAAQLNYLLFGKTPKKIPNTYRGFDLIEGDDGYYASIDPYGTASNGIRGGLTDLKGSLIFKSPKRQLVFGTGLDERFFTKVNDGDYSTWESYLSEHPEYRNNIYITNRIKSEVPQDKVISLGRPENTDVVGDMYLAREGANTLDYNASGHRLEKGILPDGRIVYRSSDLYKFNPIDYIQKRKWAANTRLNDFGVHVVDEATKNNVFLVKTPWYLQSEFHYYDSAPFKVIL